MLAHLAGAACMALRLTCPNCGSRSHTEFWFGGEIEAYPGAAQSEHGAADRAPADVDADFARVWLRANTYGSQRERWFHHAGCRRWHTAERNTLTNEIHDLA
jgi:heterotetrameric sarcosine oxidase delta subunit